MADAPAFNQEWKTRFVWAPDELALIEAARAEAMQLAALRAPGAGGAPDKKAPAAAAKPAAPVAPKPVEPAAPKPAAAAAPAAVAPKPAVDVAPKPVPPPPATVEGVKPQAAVKAAGPAQAAVQAAEAPIKPGSPVPVKPDPASAAKPDPASAAKVAPPQSPVAPKPPEAVKADVAPKPAAPPQAATAEPVVTAPPIAKAAQVPVGKPPVSDEPPPTMAIRPGDAAPEAENTVPVGAMKAPRIRGIKLVGAGIPISLGLGSFVVGRAVGSDVPLDDRQVSRSHARITVDETSAMIEDLQTVNGTLLNGEEVKARQPLRPGDTVQFGASEFKVEVTTS
jgi:hypothetical protein